MKQGINGTTAPGPCDSPVVSLHTTLYIKKSLIFFFFLC